MNSAAASPMMVTATPTSLRAGLDQSSFYGLHVPAAVLPMTAGILLYGWRAAATMGIVIITAVLAALLWRRVGSRGRFVRLPHVLWYALLLSMLLPAHLLSTKAAGYGSAMWPLLPASAVALVVCIWLMGGPGAGI